MQLDSHQQEQSYQQQPHSQHEETETIDDSPHWFTATESTAGDEVTGGVGEDEVEEEDNEQGVGDEEVFIDTPNSGHNNVVVLEQRVVTSGTAGNAKGLSNLQLGLVSRLGLEETSGLLSLI